VTSDPQTPEPFDLAAWTPAPPRVRDARFAATARRVALLLLVLAAHGLLFERLLRQEWRAPAAAPDPLLVLSFIETRAPDRPPPPPDVLRLRRGEVARPLRSPRVTRPMSAPPDVRAPVPSPPAAARPPRLFRADGSLELPETIADDLAKATDPRREFGFQVPGVVEAQARAHAPRRRAIDYQGTRFEQGWIEETDPITAGLKKAVEKTTITVRIPLPRAPGSKAVCKFSLAAMAGGCGIRNESDGYVVRDDDPDTLDADEAAQCEAWWNEVVAATTPEQLRVARDRYEAQCRKPPAAGGASPP
jgi:hypothetical protein